MEVTELAKGFRKKDYYIPDPKEGVYRANLEHLSKEAIGKLKEHPPTPVDIDHEVDIRNLSNPAFLVIVGFSGRQVYESALRSVNKYGRKKDIQYTLIIEPSWELFHQTIQRQFVGDILANPDVKVIVGTPVEEIMPELQREMSLCKHRQLPALSITPEIIVDPFCYPYTKEGELHATAATLINQVQYAAQQIKLSMGCAADQFSRWENTIKNLDNIVDSYKVKGLFDKFDAAPAIVVGGGPSVQEFLKYAEGKDIESKALIIACDAVLKKLKDHGITPHIVTRCERKKTQIFDGVTKEMTKGVYYAAYPWTDPSFFDLFDESIMLYRNNGVCRWSGFTPGLVDAGVSSAQAAFELAYLLGCKDIILTGVDLGFVDGKSHVEGTKVEFDPTRSKSQWTEVESNDGKTLTSIPIWVRCLGEYQTAIYKHQSKNATVYNTSKKGAKIAGTVVKPFAELESIFSATHDFRGKLKRNLTKHTKKEVDKFQRQRKETIKFLNDVIKDATQTLEDVRDAMRTAVREEEKSVMQLQVMDDLHKFYQSLPSTLLGLAKVYQNAAAMSDAFKDKWFKQEMFINVLLDILQLDHFQTENKCAGLKNNHEYDFTRLKFYVDTHRTFFRLVEYYAKELKEALNADSGVKS